jgi:hypothetical protein
MKDWLALSCLCWSVLGQGEICRVDPRFSSPGVTLATYWEALRTNDTETVSQCFVDPAQAVPQPGTVWFLPPSRKLSIQAVRYAPGEAGRVVATYEVRFLAVGASHEMRFIAGTELVRVRREWRVVGPAGEVAWPDWRPTRPRVDI